VDAISPELALVDDELDRSAREALPDAGTGSATEEDTVEHVRWPARGPRPAQLLTGVALFVGAVLALYALAGGSGSGKDEATPGPGSAVTPGQTEGAARLRWRPVRGAAFYNVIFWRDGERALDLWPKAPSVRVPEGRLAPGRYQWFVYPALGNGEKRRYGPVAARGSLQL
jgi:hypothetical protein